MFKFVALTVLLAISGTQAFWSPCPGVLGPTSITSDVCSGSACTLRLGQDCSGIVTINFNRAHASLMTRTTTYINGVGYESESPPQNMCNSLFRNGVLTGCPTTPGVSTEWHIYLTISKNLPVVNNARVRFEGLENGVPEICIDVNVNFIN